MRNVAINPRGTILNRTRQFIAYADDVAIIVRTAGALNEVLTQLQTAAVPTGLVITHNTNKTKCMKTKETLNVSSIDTELKGQNFERAGTFQYLGSIITTQDEIEYDKKNCSCQPVLSRLE
jgi:hypothetical protein